MLISKFVNQFVAPAVIESEGLPADEEAEGAEGDN